MAESLTFGQNFKLSLEKSLIINACTYILYTSS